MSSRTNSWSSISSTSSFQSNHIPRDLESRASKILSSLANNNDTNTQNIDLSSILQRVSLNIKVEHGDDDPIYSRQKYLSRFSAASTQNPNLHLDIKEACADESQRKVWVRSEVTGMLDGAVNERVDMLTFDESGVLIASVDWVRLRRRA